MFVRSERLFLRPIWPEDWQELNSLMADEPVVRNRELVPSLEHARCFASQPQDPQCPDFAITHLKPGAEAELVGCIGLHEAVTERNLSQFALRYWIAMPHSGHGFATEAARALLGVALALGRRRIEAWQFADNPASARVLAKLGFRPTEELASMRTQTGREAILARIHAIDLQMPDDWGLAPDK